MDKNELEEITKQVKLEIIIDIIDGHERKDRAWLVSKILDLYGYDLG